MLELALFTAFRRLDKRSSSVAESVPFRLTCLDSLDFLWREARFLFASLDRGVSIVIVSSSELSLGSASEPRSVRVRFLLSDELMKSKVRKVNVQTLNHRSA
jgi:hypothetical protein